MSEKREQTPPESPEAKRQKLDSAEESSEYDTCDSGLYSCSRRNRKHRSKNQLYEPWNYETENSLAQPPDINYRPVLLWDQETIEKLLEDESIHFTQRCLEYQTQDCRLETRLVRAHLDWAYSMDALARKGDNKELEEFFRFLCLELREDRVELKNELAKLEHAEYENKKELLARSGRESSCEYDSGRYCICILCFRKRQEQRKSKADGSLSSKNSDGYATANEDVPSPASA